MGVLIESKRLAYQYNRETLTVEPWGPDSLRVRAWHGAQPPAEDWALAFHPEDEARTEADGWLVNGRIKARLTASGRLEVLRSADGAPLLREYVRNWDELDNDCASPLLLAAREWAPIPGGDYRLIVRFESLSEEEKLFGMGQYQQSNLDLKGCELELAQRNSQASVPFVISSLGYGLLWNNPGVGSVCFGKNLTRYMAVCTTFMDYWITAGDTPMAILQNYAKVAGTAPPMPDFALGFWQSKLRYRTQQELLEAAKEHRRRGIPLAVIVADYFHWPRQGEWRFDPQAWPDPAAMVRELEEMGVKLAVSVWPTVDAASSHYAEMKEKGYLIGVERGLPIAMDFQGNTLHFDATDPQAGQYVFEQVKKNYWDLGIRLFWLDEAEPEYGVYDFDNYRYAMGKNLSVGNVYPALYARAFYEGQRQAGQTDIINLTRCAWAGSQRYGVLAWSGDVHSSFYNLRCQIVAGLNIGMAGISWWTTDIGGFQGGDPQDEAFRELVVRWFQWATFCPVMRMHGDRLPKKPPADTSGGAGCLSGADNEIWCYGERVYEILRRYIGIRTALLPYLRRVMVQAHESGVPPMRPLFLHYPKDPVCWHLRYEYLLGSDLLVAPVTEAGQKTVDIYLPLGRWQSVNSGSVQEGGRWLTVPVTLEDIPLFAREGSEPLTLLAEVLV